MSPESPESPETISGKVRERESGNSGMSLDTGLLDSPETGRGEPTSIPVIEATREPISILLSEAASCHLEATGEECFAVISKDKSDARSGRWVIHLLPCSYNLANAAVRVARGLSTERKPKPPVASSAPPLTQAEIRSA